MGASIYIWDILRTAPQPCAFKLRLPSLVVTTPISVHSRHSLPIHSFPAAILDCPPVLVASSGVPDSAGVACACAAAPGSQSHPDSPRCPVCALPANASCACCAGQFCPRHTYACPDCQSVFCADCLDLHLVEGHWSDSDTAAALAQRYRTARPAIATTNPGPPNVHASTAATATSVPAESPQSDTAAATAIPARWPRTNSRARSTPITTHHQPAPICAHDHLSTSRQLAEPALINSLTLTGSNSIRKAPTTNHNPAQCLLGRLALSALPEFTFTAIANFIRLLAFSLVRTERPFAFCGADPREVGQ